MKRIAICVSTCNRPESFIKTIHAIDNLQPQGYEVIKFVVDDASEINLFDDVAYSQFFLISGQYELYQFHERQGIARVKNKCIQLAYEWGATDFFLLDDDVIPTSPISFSSYIESGYNHLSYTFLPHNGIHGNIKTHITPNGCMLYATRKCIDKVGGMDLEYSPFLFEHPDWSRRIHNNRLTHFPYMDLVGSEKLFYCADQDKSIERSFNQDERNKQFKEKIKYFNSQAKSKEFKEFRT